MIELTPRQLAKTLRRLGFKYGVRKGVYTTKRYCERVQKSLKACCEWMHDHTELHKDYHFTDGKVADIWIFKSAFDGHPLQVGYTDESFLVSGSYRQQSWFYKGGDTVDLAAFGRKRIALLDCIFSHKNVDTTYGTRVSWDTSWKEHPKGQPEPRPFYGSCNANSIYKYYKDKVIPVFENFVGCHLFLDNASTHKRFKEEIRGCDIFDKWAHAFQGGYFPRWIIIIERRPALECAPRLSKMSQP